MDEEKQFQEGLRTVERDVIEEANAPPLEVVQMPASVTDRVLMRVRQQRLEDDRRDGFLRDYPDGTRGRQFKGPSLEQDAEGATLTLARLREATRNANPSWRHHLEHALAMVNAAETEAETAAHLVRLSAVAVAWAEALEARVDRRRIDEDAARRKKLRVVALDKNHQMVLRDAPVPAPAESKRSWLQRLLAWFRRE